LLNTWILAWDFHALTTDPWNFFNANTFYPANNALAFSEHMLGVLPLFAPFYALSGNPIFSYNITLLLSFSFCGLSMFLLAYYWSHNWWASLLAGCLFTFAPVRLARLGHLQMLNFYWAPLALLCLERFLRSQRWKDLIGSAFCYWGQVLSSVYLGWFITITIFIYACHYSFFVDRRVLARSMLMKWVVLGLSSMVMIVPLHLPYYAVKRQWGFSRSLEECTFFSADLLLSYLKVLPNLNDIYSSVLGFVADIDHQGESFLFPGMILPLLVVIASLPRGALPLRGLWGHLRPTYWTILASSWLLSLGPYLIVLGTNTRLPLPYLLLYYVVPGFRAMRVPTRFALVGALAGSVLAAVGFVWTWDTIKTHGCFRLLPAQVGQAIWAITVLGLFFLELGLKPIPYAAIGAGHDVPAVYRWLAAEQPGPILELPRGYEPDFLYMYYSTYHWQPLVNGSSGFVPPSYLRMMPTIDALPSRQAVESLSALGVRVLVLHTDRLPTQMLRQWQQMVSAGGGLEEIARFGPDIVFKLPQVETTQQLAIEFSVPQQLLAATNLKLGLLAKGRDRQAWMTAHPVGQTPVIFKWNELQTGRSRVLQEAIELPLAIPAGEYAPIRLSTHSPLTPGPYTLELSIPSLGVDTAPQLVHLTTEPLPLSSSAPQLLSAEYTLETVSSHIVVSTPLEVRLRAKNNGRAVWLARTEHDLGAVRLGWRWFEADQEIATMGGREPMLYDVFPGQAYVFFPPISAPNEPGDYVLEIGLVSEFVTWFDARGTTALKIAVRVDPLL
jgi:hypothetical protein